VSDGIACRVLIQNELLEQVDTFPYLGSLITEDGECTNQVKHRAGDRGVAAENMEKSQQTDVNEDTTNESASVACSNIRLWKLDSQKNEDTRLDAFEMKGLRKILRVSWTAKKTNEWILNKAGVKSELLDTVKARKLAYCGHTTRKQGSCQEKEIMQGTMPGARRRGRPLTAWMDNIKM